MLERLLPLPNGIPVRYVVKAFPHEFGAHREVCARYEDTDGQACDHACMVEGNTPAEWDAIARYQLLWLERRELLQRAIRRGELKPGEMPEVYRSDGFPALPVDRGLGDLLAAFPL